MDPHSSLIRKMAAMAVFIALLLAAYGTAVDSHLSFDEKCPLCQLRVHVLGIQQDSIPVPIPCFSELVLAAPEVSMPQEPDVFIATSRSPPFFS